MREWRMHLLTFALIVIAFCFLIKFFKNKILILEDGERT